jgi:preprotein translocase subunit SecF
VSVVSRLYHGQTSYDFVGHRRLWFSVSGVLLLVSLASLFVPGLNFGIDFKGGAVFRVQPERQVTEAQVREAVGPAAEVVQVTRDDPVQVIVQTEALPQEQVAEVRADLARVAGVQSNDVSTDSIGSKWGGTVSRKAVIALLVFLVAVTLYVSLRMEPKMAVAALVALVHDLVITAGIYALFRFEVSPATVIALLTILGYSLYDTVVVFDKVRENTGALTTMSRTTYSDAANLAINQTVMRSLNTSLASLLPIAALLFVGAFLLGAETLKDLALALFVGVTAGAYSSIFVAAPLVAAWKEREPRYAQLRTRVERLGAQGGAERAERPFRAAAGDAGGTRGARDLRDTRRRPPTPAPGPELPPDEELEPEVEALPGGAEGLEQERATVAPTPARRQPQKPRPAQQRRKPSGRQPSRPAKRRRR